MEGKIRNRLECDERMTKGNREEKKKGEEEEKEEEQHEVIKCNG